MEQGNDSTPSRKGKHLNRNDRILMQGFLKAGMKKSEVARQLGRDRRTIEREAGRGQVERLSTPT